MSTPIKHNQLPKFLFGIAFLFTICFFACNGSGSSSETKDTSSMAAKDSTKAMDTSMKMGADTTKKTDTSGKGGQPTPGGGK